MGILGSAQGAGPQPLATAASPVYFPFALRLIRYDRRSKSLAPRTTRVSKPFQQQSTFGSLAAWWGLIGAVAILVMAIGRLYPFAVEMFSLDLSVLHWTLVVANVLFMAWSEGYRGFQHSFSPRVAERAVLLRSDPTPIRALLAPFYVMGYFSAPRPVLILVYTISLGVIVLIQIVRALEQPWRGIVDAGVVVGLTWGALATLYHGVSALSARDES